MNIFLHNKKNSFNFYESEGRRRVEDYWGKYVHRSINVYLYPKDKEKERRQKNWNISG